MNTIPSSIDAEKALLGAILIQPTIINKIDISPNELYSVAHQNIYTSMRAIGSDKLDVLVLSELLQRRGQLDDIGGETYLIMLARECPSSYNHEAYCRIIRDTSTRRRVISIAEKLATVAFNENSGISDSIAESVVELVKSVKSSGGAVPIADYLKPLYQKAEERARDVRQIYGLETGLADFDKITHGLQKGEQFVISGAPGTGKSLLAFQLACGMAEHGYAGAFYELEMKGEAVARRRVSAVSRIPTWNILSGYEMNDRWTEFASAIAAVEDLPIYLSQESNWTTIQLRADLSRLKQNHNIEWFVIDYMGLLSDRYNGDDLARQAFISHQLCAIAKDLDLAGLMLQSVTKAGYSNPSMANVSGPTAIHHDADQIAILSKNKDNENITDLRWEKMREGDVSGIVRLFKEPGLPSFQCAIDVDSEPESIPRRMYPD